ncbi:hypothetical protein A0H81_08610 [Grifola frondosa]|uniref:Uncharacterized protein n=1 Tax=Grifola frondosa TaxID=5627 RepID=A0A1C7M3N4_GRIFR|nr:hypothetical protein A0H81_08610 [Grifola frondosa]
MILDLGWGEGWAARFATRFVTFWIPTAWDRIERGFWFGDGVQLEPETGIDKYEAPWTDMQLDLPPRTALSYSRHSIRLSSFHDRHAADPF